MFVLKVKMFKATNPAIMGDKTAQGRLHGHQIDKIQMVCCMTHSHPNEL